MVSLARVVVTRHPCACMQACMEATYGGNDRHAGMCSMTFASLAPMQIRMQFQMHRQLRKMYILGTSRSGPTKILPGIAWMMSVGAALAITLRAHASPTTACRYRRKHCLYACACDDLCIAVTTAHCHRYLGISKLHPCLPACMCIYTQRWRHNKANVATP